jgi:hypothetical protein
VNTEKNIIFIYIWILLYLALLYFIIRKRI